MLTLRPGKLLEVLFIELVPSTASLRFNALFLRSIQPPIVSAARATGDGSDDDEEEELDTELSSTSWLTSTSKTCVVSATAWGCLDIGT